MYPFLRLAKELVLNSRRGPLPLGEVHVTRLRVRPWDIDPFLDLNNGRVLTLMDLGRFGYFVRAGILKALKEKGWYGTVAGTAIRYRRRITVLQKLELRTRVLGWDERFVYFDHVFWRGDEPCVQAVIRTAISNGKGIVPTLEIAEAFGFPHESPDLPDWVSHWAEAEQVRPWPPEN